MRSLLQASPILHRLSPLRCLRSPLDRRALCTLAIETSCDDTSVAILERRHVPRDPSGPGSRAKLLFHKKITSQNAQYGGIHPIASLESHHENVALLVKEALSSLPDATTGDDDSPRHFQGPAGGDVEIKVIPDFVSVTRGPGMRSNLQAGLDVAKGLSVAWGVPLVGVHHMQAHALTPRLLAAMEIGSHDQDTLAKVKPEFPFLSLLISGGHTLLIHSISLTEHRVLANTSDIAIGLYLDKAARSVLPAEHLSTSKTTMYGAMLEQFAFSSSAEGYAYKAPKTMAQSLTARPTVWGWSITPPFSTSPGHVDAKRMGFSFSGMTTAVQRIGESIKESDIPGEKPEHTQLQQQKDLSKETMRVAFEHLASRIIVVLRHLEADDPEAAMTLKTIVVSGGVAANGYLRHILSSFLEAQGYPHMKFEFPAPEYCTDNAAMVAWTGMEMFAAGHTTSLSARAIRKWPLDAIL